MNKLWVCMLIVVSLMFVTGCRDQRILEKLGFTQTTSYDLLPDGKLRISVAIPKADPEATTTREVLTTTSWSSKEARIQMSGQTNLILVSGQLRNVLFGLSLAKKGLGDHVDTLVRDPSIAPRVKITVVNGDAGELLQTKFSQHPRTGKYIDRLLEKEADRQMVPKVTLLDFTRDYFDDGIDPIAPVIKSIGDSITTDGIALFQDDKYITKIPQKDAIIFAFLKEEFEQGELSMDLGEQNGKKEIVMLSSMVSTKDVKVQSNSSGSKKVTFVIGIKGSVLEYMGRMKLSNDKDRHALEKRISDFIKKDADRIVKLMQRNRVDSLGIGKYVRNSMSYSEWKSMTWREELPRVQVQYDINVKIKDYGKFR